MSRDSSPESFPALPVVAVSKVVSKGQVNKTDHWQREIGWCGVPLIKEVKDPAQWTGGVMKREDALGGQV